MMNTSSCLVSHSRFIKQVPVSTAASPSVLLKFDNNTSNSGTDASVVISTINSASMFYQTTYKVNGTSAIETNKSNGTYYLPSLAYFTFNKNIQPPFTVSMWIMPSYSVSSNNKFFEIKTNSVDLYGTSSYNTFQAQANATACAFRGAPYAVMGTWYHCAVVFTDATTFSVYRDGAFISSATLPSGGWNTLGELATITVGWAKTYGTANSAGAFVGRIDCFAIYDKALTTGQINTIFTSNNSTYTFL